MYVEKTTLGQRLRAHLLTPNLGEYEYELSFYVCMFGPEKRDDPKIQWVAERGFENQVFSGNLDEKIVRLAHIYNFATLFFQEYQPHIITDKGYVIDGHEIDLKRKRATVIVEENEEALQRLDGLVNIPGYRLFKQDKLPRIKIRFDDGTVNHLRYEPGFSVYEKGFCRFLHYDPGLLYVEEIGKEEREKPSPLDKLANIITALLTGKRLRSENK